MPARQAGRNLKFEARSRTSRQTDIQQIYMHNRLRTDRNIKARRQDKMRVLKAYSH